MSIRFEGFINIESENLEEICSLIKEKKSNEIFECENEFIYKDNTAFFDYTNSSIKDFEILVNEIVLISKIFPNSKFYFLTIIECGLELHFFNIKNGKTSINKKQLKKLKNEFQNSGIEIEKYKKFVLENINSYL